MRSGRVASAVNSVFANPQLRRIELAAIVDGTLEVSRRSVPIAMTETGASP
ncbi:MAG: hypothetical protein M3065_17815 [Actinomycetota bacterium]|nr:hypothetical protein [Actinomycetota bacterium]